MFKPRPCGCKGIRTCFICEAELGLKKVQPLEQNLDVNPECERLKQEKSVYEYCYLCDKAWRGSGAAEGHPNHVESLDSIDFPGVLLIPDFLTDAEETALVSACDSMPWDLSQSGRRKQNFGPKTNFKKKKLKMGQFSGFPAATKFAQDKLKPADPLLADFQTIEQCAIEYRPETGACIDPHIDDCWVWGERVISVSLLSDSVLSMNPYRVAAVTDKPRYNLEYYENNNDLDLALGQAPYSSSSIVVKIPMPRRSLLVLHGPARYEWEHAVLREDIHDRRICMAYREFTKQYLPGGESYEGEGAAVLEKAKCFW